VRLRRQQVQKMYEFGGAMCKKCTLPDDPEISVLFFTVLNGEKLYTPARCKFTELEGAADMLRHAGKGELSGVVDKDTLECLLADITEFESKQRVTETRSLFGWWREPEESFLVFTRLDDKESYAPIRCKPSKINCRDETLKQAGKSEVVGVIQQSMLAAMLAELMIFEREHGIK
jgi:hypothetical protein